MDGTLHPITSPHLGKHIFHYSLPELHYAVVIFLVVDVCQEVIETFLPGTENPNAKCVEFQLNQEQTKLFKFASTHLFWHNIQLVCE